MIDLFGFCGLIHRGWFNCCWCEGAEVNSGWPNGHSENSEETEESGESGYYISWTCKRREERREERGEKGREEGREKGREERGKEGREERREEGGEKIEELILNHHRVFSFSFSNSTYFSLCFAYFPIFWSNCMLQKLSIESFHFWSSGFLLNYLLFIILLKHGSIFNCLDGKVLNF